MKDAISYIRVSSEEQADSGLGLEAQRQRMSKFRVATGEASAQQREKL